MSRQDAGMLQRLLRGANREGLQRHARACTPELDRSPRVPIRHRQVAEPLRALVVDFRADLERHGGEPIFRIHWDGDFYSLAYARAWAIVIAENPDIRFWAYTRSFRGRVNVVPTLASLENLTLYLSVDRDNAGAARTILRGYPNARAATLTDTATDGATMLADLGRAYAPACPENTRRIPLVLAGRGPNGNGAGACAACGLCIRGTRDVRFAIAKR